MDEPDLQYPAPRPVIAFSEWLAGVYLTKEISPDLRAHGSFDHFETRANYAEYIVIVWEDPVRHLSSFETEVVGRALNDSPRPYLNTRLPKPLRVRAWKALDNLLLAYIEPRVRSRLSSLDKVNPIEAKNQREEIVEARMKMDRGEMSWKEYEGLRNQFAPPALETACYMWWDISLSFDSAADFDFPFFVAHCRKCLASPNLAIQESMLHGLGHAISMSRRSVRKELRGLIDDFLATTNPEGEIRQ